MNQEVSYVSDEHLKYSRRTKRLIDGEVVEITPPGMQRSITMQNIKSSDTSIEKIVEQKLIEECILYTKPEFVIGHIDGKPDFVLPKYRVAIFCDGDFWHGYEYEKNQVKTNTEFWNKKIERNIVRDKEVTYGLESNNWKVFRFWEHKIKADPEACIDEIRDFIIEKENGDKSHKFTFIDLFAGIGGFRVALEELGGKCLGFSEIDKKAIETYKLNFVGSPYHDEIELGDITKISKLPFKVDVVVGGVPCQSWSIAGRGKGFEDPRGKLWEDSIRVVKENQPKYFVFENVKGLMDPRNKENLDLIVNSLDKAGYNVIPPRLLNSYDFGVPQNRDRIFIVGFRKDLKLGDDFSYPESLNLKMTIADILESVNAKEVKKAKIDPSKIHGTFVPKARNRFQKENELNDFFVFCDVRNGHTSIHSWELTRTTKREKEICMTILRNRRKKKYGSADGNPMTFADLSELIPKLKEQELHKLEEKSILKRNVENKYMFVNSKISSGINGIYRVYLPHSEIFSTLTATGTKDMIALDSVESDNPEEYKEKFIRDIFRKKKFRPITSREAGKLQGFPDWFAVHEVESYAKKQFGNAVSAPVIYHLGKSINMTGVFKTKKTK